MMMVEELLNKYDLYHSSIINGGKTKFNINYLPDGNIYISLVAMINNEEVKYSQDTVDSDDFYNCYLPKILQCFFSKNVKIKIRKIMGNETQGTIIVERTDLKDVLIIRNCSVKIMDLVTLLYDCSRYVSNYKVDSMIIIDENYRQYDNYIKYNILFDYAKYKNALSIDYDAINQEDLLMLNIARFAYSLEDSKEEDIFLEVQKCFPANSKVEEICNQFKNNDFKEENKLSHILNFAEYEKNNDMLIQNNTVEVEQAYEACKNGVKYFDSNYVDYWINKQKEYENSANEEYQAICIDFIDAHDLYKKVAFTTKNNNKKEKNGNLIISKIKKIKEEKNSFTSIIKDPIKKEDLVEEEVEKIFSALDKDQIKIDAEEQAKKIIQLQKEKEEIEKAADEYARTILKNEKMYKMIEESAKVQALRIIELEKQNEELKKLAEENARYIIEKEKELQDEAELRKEINDTPVKSQDIDKINNLLYDLSVIKNLDVTIEHPTIMQNIEILEEKLITYLATHKNIIHEDPVMMPIEKEEMIERKPVIELLSMIRNAYVSSHSFEKDGRHTLINFNPVDEDTFRISLYSIKDDSEDLLMDAFFEKYQLTENVLEEICDIYKNGAVIVASKTDNIPPDKADYLVIDNMNNAIRFMDCERNIIDKVKEFL